MRGVNFGRRSSLLRGQNCTPIHSRDNRTAATTAYLALETQSAKSAALIAIARNNLTHLSFAVLSAILAVARRNQKARDKLAHHVWGISPEVKDALITADQKVLIWKGHSPKDMFVYKSRELRKLARDNYWIADIAIRFRDILRAARTDPDEGPSPQDPELDQLLSDLCEEPVAQETLDRLASPTQSQPKAIRR